MNSTTDPPVMSGFGHLFEQEILPLRRYARALTRERGDDVVPDLPGLQLGLFHRQPRGAIPRPSGGSALGGRLRLVLSPWW
jgi:hypothetical protein